MLSMYTVWRLILTIVHERIRRFADREHVKNLTSVTALQEALLRALRYQIDSNHADNDQLFGRLLMTMTQLRELSTEHKKLLNLIKGLPEKSHDEIFGLIE